MIRKLRVKLVCILMALLTVMLGVTFGLVLHFTQQSLEAESLRTLEALANNWQTASSPGLDDGTRVPYFALEINARGDIITTRGGYFDLSDREKLQKLIDIAVNSEDDIGEVPDYGLRFYRVVTRTSWRVVFADTSAETTTLHSLIRTLAIASAAALAVFFVMSLLLARWLVRPVARAWDQQRQFVADASHELKTPLTVILTNAELLQAPGYDAPARSRFAGSILTMSQQMRGLVESLLELARVDAGRAQDAQTELDLSTLVNEADGPRGGRYPCARQCRTAAAGRGDPAGQRPQIRPAGRLGAADACAAGRAALRAVRRGPRRAADPAGVPRYLQALLPRRFRPRHEPQLRPGPCHRRPHRRGAPRPHLGREQRLHQPVLFYDSNIMCVVGERHAAPGAAPASSTGHR